ncbi:MAG TPA: hypothetical protein VK003_10015, partial [Oceanobacillus sp.]|nr:hypothetical protein [Oceanobacillus sp.]
MMTTEAKQTSGVSTGELLTLFCVILLVVGFLALPWLVVDGSSYSGLALLTEAQTATSYDVSQAVLLPVAAIVGGLAGLCGLSS